MKRVRITIDPTELELRPLYHHLTDGDRIERTDIVNWNVSDPPTGFLFQVRGAYETLEVDLAESSYVDDFEILPLSDRECYCFMKGRATPESRALFENFTRGSLLTVPPVSLNRNQHLHSRRHPGRHPDGGRRGPRSRGGDRRRGRRESGRDRQRRRRAVSTSTRGDRGCACDRLLRRPPRSHPRGRCRRDRVCSCDCRGASPEGRIEPRLGTVRLRSSTLVDARYGSRWTPRC
jgi:hypothetical protein